MKQYFANWTRNDLCTIAVALLAFALPFSIIALPYFIGLAIVSLLFQSNLKDKVVKAMRFPFFVLPAAFYLWHIVGLLYSHNLADGLFNVQVKVSLVLIPFVIAVASETIAVRFRFILGSFIAGNFIAAITCLVLAFIHSFSGGQFIFFNDEYSGVHNLLSILFSGYSHFNYTRLSALIHVNYYAMFILMVVYFLYNDFRIRRRYMVSKKKVVYAVLMVFFLFFFILMQSRSGFLSLLGIICLEFFFLLKDPKHTRIKLLVLISLISMLVVVVVTSDRVNRMFQGSELPTYTELKETEIRLMLWEIAIPIIKDNLLLGVGTGDADEAYRNKFTSTMLEESKGSYLNVHNEYLHTAMRLGIPAALLLVIMILYPLRYPLIRSKYRFVLGFIVIILVGLFFESALNRLYGVVFFTLLYSLFGVVLMNPKQND